jgi:GAF domain-containing protein
VEDAQHVVCSLQQAQEYLASLAAPGIRDGLAPVVSSASGVRELQPLDETKVDIFDQIVTSAAKALEAPIALINIREGGSEFWRAQCGLPENEKNTPSALRHSSICADVTLDGRCMIIADTAEDPRFRDDPILIEKGIRFFAGLPIVGQDGREIGSLCVFDTRPRQITDQQRESLKSLSTSVTKAIELQPVAEGASSSSSRRVDLAVDSGQSRTAQLLSEVREER